MPLAKEAIESFQAAYKQDHGEEIGFEEAAIMARELVWFVRELCTVPIPHGNAPDHDLSPSCDLTTFQK